MSGYGASNRSCRSSGRLRCDGYICKAVYWMNIENMMMVCRETSVHVAPSLHVFRTTSRNDWLLQICGFGTENRHSKRQCFHKWIRAGAHCSERVSCVIIYARTWRRFIWFTIVGFEWVYIPPEPLENQIKDCALTEVISYLWVKCADCGWWQQIEVAMFG